MATGAFLRDYIIWHYGRAILEFFELFGNFFWFFFHFFSIGILSRTLVSPIFRLQEKYKKGFDPEAIFQSLIVNLVSRIAGFFIRLTLILAGVFAEILMLLLMIPSFIVWIFLPAIVPVLFVAGFSLILL